MRLGRPVMAGLALALLAGCAAQPMTRDRAARLCADEARQADGISGDVRFGAGSRGAAGGGSLMITSAILDPQSEEDALRACIDRRLAGDNRPPRRAGVTFAIEGDFR
ncbi:hypothetical protein P6F26_13635 [Roseibacterium sp. SDUM158017]|uniref:hypothetical protein n=1 Tax=Roseicyclus salinarum TaxID=3036773 RepID=UPI0024155B97|nr:hypothetical protein [Roseibacterium sp. SDUM158017]MDG4649479.1 hypothetical protein [Roseibacterium sp. SDUM158017]